MMRGWAADIINFIENAAENKNINGFKLCSVKSIKPFIFTYNGVDLGEQLGDTVFVHPLMVSEKINLDKEDLYKIQDFQNSTAYKSPEFKASIKGSLPDFIKDFYLFYEKWQSTYLLNVGDLVAVYELGNNNYVVLQKVAKYLSKENAQHEGEV